MQKLDEAHRLFYGFQPTLVTVRLFQGKLLPELHLNWNSLPLNLLHVHPFTPGLVSLVMRHQLKEGQLAG